jgi:hypothetical protein
VVEQAGGRASSGRLVINYQGCHNDLVCVCYCCRERENASDDEFRADTEGWLVGRLAACLMMMLYAARACSRPNGGER